MNCTKCNELMKWCNYNMANTAALHTT